MVRWGGIVAAGLALAAGRADTILLPEESFKAAPGQTIFPVESLNVFKQYLVEWKAGPAGLGWIVDPSWFPGRYGARIGFETEGVFGVEIGACLGGRVDFELVLRPELVLPARVVTGVQLPLRFNVSLLPPSRFTTSFDGVGQAYADLILDARARVDSRICLIECTDALRHGFDTRDYLRLSQRCDPAIDWSHPPRAGIELASFNRAGSGQMRVLRVAQPVLGLWDFGYERSAANREVVVTNGGTVITNKARLSALSLAGNVSISNPAMHTDSARSAFCQAGRLCSSGRAELFRLALDVGAFIEGLMPRSIGAGGASDFGPKLKGQLNYSGLSASYTLAELLAGPAVSLQLDHELDWDLWVTSMGFSAPIRIGQRSITDLRQLHADGVVPSRRYQLTDTGPYALPLIELQAAEPVRVEVTYEVAPRLRTRVSVPIEGRIDYEILSASAAFAGGPLDFGPLRIGPVLQGRKEFSAGSMTAYVGERSLTAASPGRFAFVLQPTGAARYRRSLVNTDRRWEAAENWLEAATGRRQAPTPLSDAEIPPNLLVDLTSAATVASLGVAEASELRLRHAGASAAVIPRLAIQGGFMDNRGLVVLNESAVLEFGTTEAVLAGNGQIVLNPGAGVAPEMKGYTGAGDFVFVNHNRISGGGGALRQYRSNAGKSTIQNLGSIMATRSTADLRLSAHRIVNERELAAQHGARLGVFSDRMELAPGSLVRAEGADSRAYLAADSAEHAGAIRASAGGRVEVDVWRHPTRPRWNAGEAIRADRGGFEILGSGSELNLRSVDMNGGCFLIQDRGSLVASDCTFNASVVTLGAAGASALDDGAWLSLSGTQCHFRAVSLANYGTITAATEVVMADAKLFANHGTLIVPAGRQVRVLALAAGSDALGAGFNGAMRPGVLNAAGDKLVGGTWRIAGALQIDGALFRSIGADPAVGSTASGYVAPDGTARAGEGQAGGAHGLSGGRPARVSLEGPAWSFPSIRTLSENEGHFALANGAIFQALGAFTNRGQVLVRGQASALSARERFAQLGPGAGTVVLAGGALSSGAGDYQILGGSLVVEHGARALGLSGAETVMPAGSIRVASTLRWFFTGTDANPQGLDARPEPCVIQLPEAWRIEAIGAGASVEWHGSEIQFRNLSAQLRRVTAGGRLAVSGEQLNRGMLELSRNTGEAFVNSGEISVRGYSSELAVTGNYVQGAGSTLVGRGAGMSVSGNLIVDGGEFVIELGPRRTERWNLSYLSAPVSVNGLGRFHTGLVVRFEEVAVADHGDAWVLVNGSNVGVPAPSAVSFRGIRVAPGARLEVAREGPGLIVRVVPDVPVLGYDAWLGSFGIPSGARSPVQDADGDGFSNGNEFLFGSHPTRYDAALTTPLTPGLLRDGNGSVFYELAYNRPAGVMRRDAFYTVYVADAVGGRGGDWRQGIFQVAEIRPLGANMERVLMRSTVRVDDRTQLYARVGGGPLGLPAGSMADHPILEDPGDLVRERGNIGKVIFFKIQGDRTASGGTVYGGPHYADRSSLRRAVVHAGAVPDTDRSYVVKVVIWPPSNRYVGTVRHGVGSQDLIELERGTVSFTVAPAY